MSYFQIIHVNGRVGRGRVMQTGLDSLGSQLQPRPTVFDVGVERVHVRVA
jgi:hypothetical protein